MQITKTILSDIKDIPKVLSFEEDYPVNRQGSRHWSFDVEFDKKKIPSDLSLKVFARRNHYDEENFSCGIQMIKDGRRVNLSRYNGSNHVNDVANYECHIHNATVESINRGDRTPEHDDTKVTQRYSEVDGAFKCLCDDYNMDYSSISQPNLFGRILP